MVGFDTKFWGPSAWQLFHLLAHRSAHPHKVLRLMKDVLPCRFCRESTRQFSKEHPLRSGQDPGRWMYKIHTLVNAKLRKQSEEDPAVKKPTDDPPYAEVKAKYEDMKPTAVPGRDFLFIMASSYPDEPESSDIATQSTFLHELAEVYPFEELRQVFKKFIADHPPALESRIQYRRWMYRLLSDLSKKVGLPMPSISGYAHRASYYRSGCDRKSYHGKTCRRLAGGGRTKDRDHRRTYKVSHAPLL